MKISIFLNVCLFVCLFSFCFFVFFSIWVFIHDHSSITGLQKKGEVANLENVWNHSSSSVKFQKFGCVCISSQMIIWIALTVKGK